MKNIGILGIGAGLVGISWYLISHRRPAAHWQVGSIISGQDPEEGWINLRVGAIEWRGSYFFDLNKTQYKPQWWYRLDDLETSNGLLPGNVRTAGWYPEEFLKSVATG